MNVLFILPMCAIEILLCSATIKGTSFFLKRLSFQLNKYIKKICNTKHILGKKTCLNVELRGTNMVSALFILQGAKNAG